jgi:hypothetical protein
MYRTEKDKERTLCQKRIVVNKFMAHDVLTFREPEEKLQEKTNP